MASRILGINCCRHCVPPKRHLHCHSECEEYKKEKAELEINREKHKESINPLLSNYDFDEIEFAGCKNYKKKVHSYNK